jgi:hypothetical protein
MLSLWPEIRNCDHHAALTWLNSVKSHQCVRKTRWVLKLGEYEFEIEHKPGKKHVNVDCVTTHCQYET